MVDGALTGPRRCKTRDTAWTLASLWRLFLRASLPNIPAGKTWLPAKTCFSGPHRDEQAENGRLVTCILGNHRAANRSFFTPPILPPRPNVPRSLTSVRQYRCKLRRR